jgi:rhamnosyltransferase
MDRPDAGRETSQHWVVVPLFGPATGPVAQSLLPLLEAGLGLVLVDNNPAEKNPTDAGRGVPWPVADHLACRWVRNANRGGIAGGFNSGVEAALALGARTITLLDQDSGITPAGLQGLRDLLERYPSERLLVGPRIWDQRRQRWHDPVLARWLGHPCARLLISSGTTFAATQWPLLGPLDEELFIDFVDHAWCFRAQAAGFVLLQHPGVQLAQQFGDPHPNGICRWLGMELYSPQRHYYSLRNLRWLLRQGWVPIDLRIKELIKMLVKPWLWLLFEPKRRANARAILAGLTAPLPQAAGAMVHPPAESVS